MLPADYMRMQRHCPALPSICAPGLDCTLCAVQCGGCWRCRASSAVLQLLNYCFGDMRQRSLNGLPRFFGVVCALCLPRLQSAPCAAVSAALFIYGICCVCSMCCGRRWHHAVAAEVLCPCLKYVSSRSSKPAYCARLQSGF